MTGTLQQLQIEGGECWRLRSDTASYNPLGLPSSFRTDSLRVRVEAVRRPDLAHVCVTGAVIDVQEIERR